MRTLLNCLLILLCLGCERTAPVVSGTPAPLPVDMAISKYEKLVKESPEDLGYWTHLAQKYEQKSTIVETSERAEWQSKAESAFESVVQLAERQQESISELTAAEFFRRTGRPERARELYTQARLFADAHPERTQDRSAVRRMWAGLEAEQGELELAHELLTSAIALAPEESPLPYMDRAKLLQGQGNKAEAIKDAEAALEILGKHTTKEAICDTAEVRRRAELLHASLTK